MRMIIMKKIKEWDKGKDKMIINTGHKAFDEQTNLIAEGNIVASTVWGKYVRSWGDVKSHYRGTDPEPGYLQQFDLEWFYPILSPDERRVLREMVAGIELKVCVYVFFHYRNGTQIIVHGFSITNAEDHKLLKVVTLGPTRKSIDVMVGATPYVSNENQVADVYVRYSGMICRVGYAHEFKIDWGEQ